MDVAKKHGFLILLGILLLVCVGELSLAEEENEGGNKYEFSSPYPPLFLPEKYWNKAHPEYQKRDNRSIPASEFEANRKLWEKATATMLNRLTIPLLPDGATKPQLKRYYSYLYKELRKIDPGVKLRPPAGILRDIFNLQYQMALRAARNGVAPMTILQQLADGSHSIYETNGDLLGFKIRALGSDIDVLIEVSDPKKYEAVRKKGVAITGAVEEALGLKGAQMEEAAKRTLFPKPDFLSYHTLTNERNEVLANGQMPRAIRQGGSTQDFLAFDLEKGTFLEPTDYLREPIVDNLMRGFYSYVAPEEGKMDNAEKQNIRGQRGMLTNGSLSLLNPEQFLAELRINKEKLQRGEYPNASALDIYERIARNGYASNRIYRAQPGTLEAEILAYNLAVEAALDRGTVPERVDELPLGRGDCEGNACVPVELRMDRQTFIKKHTDKGKLYHGTPNFRSGIALLRGGMFVSKHGGRIGKGMTRALYGRGGYTTPNLSTAYKYAGDEGVVFELQVKNDDRLVILDWGDSKVRKSKFIQKVYQEVEQLHGELNEKEALDKVFERLTNHYGVDIIVNHHVLIENTEALRFPDTPGTIIRAYQTLALNKKAMPTSRVQAALVLPRLRVYSETLGENVSKKISLNKLQQEVIQIALNGNRTLQRDAVDALTLFPRLSAEGHKALNLIAENGKTIEARITATKVIGNLQYNHPEHRETLRSIVRKARNVKHRREALEKLVFGGRVLEPKTLALLTHIAKNSREGELKWQAIFGLTRKLRISQRKRPEVVEACIACLKAGHANDLREDMVRVLAENLNNPKAERALINLLQSGRMSGEELAALITVLGDRINQDRWLNLILGQLDKIMSAKPESDSLRSVGARMAHRLRNNRLSKVGEQFAKHPTENRGGFDHRFGSELHERIGQPGVYGFLKKHGLVQQMDLAPIHESLLNGIHNAETFRHLMESMRPIGFYSRNYDAPEGLGKALVRPNTLPHVMAEFGSATVQNIEQTELQSESISEFHEFLLNKMLEHNPASTDRRFRKFLLHLFNHYPVSDDVRHQVREMALMGLGPAMHVKSISDLVLSHFRNEASPFHEAATGAMGNGIASGAVPDEIIQSLRGDSDPWIRRLIHIELRSDPDKNRLLDYADEMIRKDSDIQNKGVAVRTLSDVLKESTDGRIRAKARRLLVKALKSPHESVSKSAVMYLHWAGEVNSLIKVAREVGDHQKLAIEFLGKHLNIKKVERFFHDELLIHADESIRKAAAESIRRSENQYRGEGPTVVDRLTEQYRRNFPSECESVLGKVSTNT